MKIPKQLHIIDIILQSYLQFQSLYFARHQFIRQQNAFLQLNEENHKPTGHLSSTPRISLSIINPHTIGVSNRLHISVPLPRSILAHLPYLSATQWPIAGARNIPVDRLHQSRMACHGYGWPSWWLLAAGWVTAGRDSRVSAIRACLACASTIWTGEYVCLMGCRWGVLGGYVECGWVWKTFCNLVKGKSNFVHTSSEDKRAYVFWHGCEVRREMCKRSLQKGFIPKWQKVSTMVVL